MQASFISMLSMGDKGNNDFEWSDLSISYRNYVSAGSTGALTTQLETTAGTVPGLGWSVSIAIQP